MPKITRTFRLDSDLVERFDKAAEIANVDKTFVVTEAIKKFVEGIETKKFWNTDNLVEVAEIYAPFIGKAKLNNGTANLEEDLTVIQSTLYGFNSQRKDENSTRYTIENTFATIDFENKICTIEYKLFWIGGKVENKEIKFPIKWKESSNDLIGITEITVFEDK